MELGWQIGWRYMYFSILRIRARRNGCSVCNPHAGGRAAGTQQPWRRRRRQVNDFRIITGKTQLPEYVDRGTILRRQYALPDTQVGKMFHFCQALQSRFPRVRVRQRIFPCRNISLCQAAVVMRRPDQPIKIDFVCTHVSMIKPARLVTFPIVPWFQLCG